jgi:hypothetical protein
VRSLTGRPDGAPGCAAAPGSGTGRTGFRWPRWIGQHADFIGLAAAHEQRCVRRLALAGDAGYRLRPAVWASRPSSSSSASKWGIPRSTPTRMAGTRGVADEVDEAGELKSAGYGKYGSSCVSPLGPGAQASGGFGTFGCREVHGAARHDGRDGVLVDHLGDRVAQQDDVLVEGLDLALQLDAVDEVDRHRHMLTAQGIEEGVLQELPFVAHDILRVQEVLLESTPYHSPRVIK